MPLPRSRVALAGAALVPILIGILVWVWVSAPAPTAEASPTPSPTPSASPTASPTPSPTPTATPSPTPTPEPVAVCPYTGRPVGNPSVLDRPAFLVQVENNPIGRPTSGLNAADLVIEAPVEGDTTRFAAVYLCGKAPPAIAPIRSARYYNTDLWRQLHVVTAHFGAGASILREFIRTHTPFVNGIAGRWPFYIRQGPLPAPHNVTFDLRLARRMAEQGALGARVDQAGRPRAPFHFNEEARIPDGRRVGGVTVFTNPYWNFSWTWDGSRDEWLRTDDGVPAVDALTGNRLSARTVVVQIVRQTILHGETDPGGYPRRYQHLIGSGQGILYAEGRAIPIRWDRDRARAVTRWTYARGGRRMVLPPGRVWWEIIPVGSSVTNR